MKRPIFNKEQVKKIINLYEDGKFIREIARIYGVSNTTIKNYLKRNNVILRCPKKEMSRHASSRILDKNPLWKGGKVKLDSGYIRINLGNNKTMLEHRYIMEKHLGRRLKSDEHVHHKNGIKDDNRIDNLQVMSASDHSTLTGLERIEDETHNSYIHVEKTELMKMILEGKTSNDICKHYNFSLRTFYNKLESFNIKEWYKEAWKNVKQSDHSRKIG